MKLFFRLSVKRSDDNKIIAVLFANHGTNYGIIQGCTKSKGVKMKRTEEAYRKLVEETVKAQTEIAEIEKLSREVK